MDLQLPPEIASSNAPARLSSRIRIDYCNPSGLRSNAQNSAVFRCNPPFAIPSAHPWMRWVTPLRSLRNVCRDVCSLTTASRSCQYGHVISDGDIAQSLARVPWRFASARNDQLDYELRDIRLGEGTLDLELAQRDGHNARLQLELPSSGRPQPWLYTPPDDADDWVGQLLVWMDEEVFTLGLGKSRVRVVRDGASYVVVVPYSWQLKDSQRHSELLDAAGPYGWNGDVLSED